MYCKPFLFSLVNFSLLPCFLPSLSSFYTPSKLNYFFYNILPSLLPVILHIQFSLLGTYSLPCINQVSASIISSLTSPGWFMGTIYVCLFILLVNSYNHYFIHGNECGSRCCTVVKRAGSSMTLSRFESHLCHLLNTLLLVSCLPFLCLSFLICKIRMTIIPIT